VDRDLRLLLVAWKYARVLVALPVAWISWKTGVLAYTAGLLTHEAILVGLWALLLAACSAWVILVLGDRMIAGIARIKEGWRVAKLLEEWHEVGHRNIRIADIVGLWLEKAPENPTVRTIKENTMLRILKAAVHQGLITRSAEEPEEIDKRTYCEIKSVAEFFRGTRWLEVKKEKLETAAAPATTSVSQPPRIRNNWITRNRDYWNGW
jgi:hypothetical protein